LFLLNILYLQDILTTFIFHFLTH